MNRIVKRLPPRVRPLVVTGVSWDTVGGLFAFVIALLLILHQKQIRQQAIGIFLVQGALGIAILAVVLAALSILVAFMGDEYLVILDSTPGGVKGATLPYRFVAVVSCGLTLLSFAGAISWSLLPDWVGSVALSAACGLSVCAVVGTGQLVFITAFHGERRADVLRAMRKARGILDQRRHSA